MAGVARVIEPVAIGEHVVAEPRDDPLERLRVERDRLVEPFGDLVRGATGAHRTLTLARVGEILRRERGEVGRRLERHVALEEREEIGFLSGHMVKIVPTLHCQGPSLRATFRPWRTPPTRRRSFPW